MNPAFYQGIILQVHFIRSIEKYHKLYHYDDILESPIRITEIRSKIINGD